MCPEYTYITYLYFQDDRMTLLVLTPLLYYITHDAVWNTELENDSWLQ